MIRAGRPHRLTIAFALVAAAVCLVLTVARAGAPHDPSAPSAPETHGGAAPVAPGPAPTAAALAPAAPPPAPKVRIVFKIYPPNRATVHWGKKNLGLIKPRAPLIIERPRDSGPLDVVVRADGCVPVHTRAYTFTDTTVNVKVTPLDKKNTIYGYREAPPPDVDGGVPAGAGGPDGGVPAGP